MGQQRGILTPEERARVMQLQDLLIERFVEHREAVAEGQEERVRTVKPKSTVFCAKRKRSRTGRLQARPSRSNEACEAFITSQRHEARKD